MRILRLKDRVTVNFQDFSIVLKPLSYDERSKIESYQKYVAGEIQTDWAKTIFYTLKYSIADVKGLKDFQGNEIEVEKDGDYLSDDMITDLYNASIRKDILICINRIENEPEKFISGDIDLESVKSVKLGN